MGHRNVLLGLLLGAIMAASPAAAETLTVSNTDSNGARTSFATEPGATYQITASGVVSDWPDHEDGVDPAYCYGPWRCAAPEAWYQLRINGKGLNEIAGHDLPYNGGHTYTVTFTGDGSPISFVTADAMSSAGDNHGAFTVTVTQTGGGNGPGGPGPVTNGGDDDHPQIHAMILCDPNPLVITISALPSKTCTIQISNWKHNTAAPVRVIMVDAIDGFGNHANGIQIPLGASPEGTSHNMGMDPSLMSGYLLGYSWNISVFACPGQPGAGVNCYGAAAKPGPFVLHFRVEQDGAEPAMVTLLGTALPPNPMVHQPGQPPAGQQPPQPQGATLVRIENHWKPDQFIHVEHGRIESGTIRADWASAVWALEPVPGTTFFRIHNRWKQDQYIHIEHGYVESGPIGAGWQSAMWRLEPVTGNLYRIQNTWKQDQYLHIEHGFIESSPVGNDWLSAVWAMTDPNANAPSPSTQPTRFVRIHNRWRTDQYLNIEHGRPESGPIGQDWLSAFWVLEPVQGSAMVRIRNRWKQDQYLHIEHGTLESGPIQPQWLSAMWTLDPVQGQGWVRLQNGWKPNLYLHVEHGALEIGTIEAPWLSAMWSIE